MKKYRVGLALLVLAALATACGGVGSGADALTARDSYGEDRGAADVAGAEKERVDETPKVSDGAESQMETKEDDRDREEGLMSEQSELPGESGTKTVYAVTKVNIRTAPDTEAEIYGTLGAGQTAERLRDEGEWSAVIVDGKAYYIASRYLKSKPDGSTEKETGGETNGDYLVVIDAGHQQKGNSEKEPVGPGASEMKAKVAGGTSGRASGLKEHELTLRVARKLEAILLGRGYQVLMVRTSGDVNISNAERAAVANDAGADVFIRIHANGSEDSGVNGAMTICQTSSNPYNGSLHDQSRALSDSVLDAFTEKTGARKQRVWETDTMSGINWALVPTTIIEMGYMTNEAEDLKMASEDYQELMAEGMADGIGRYLGTEIE